MNLLGVDVGFSADSKTTGLAWRVNGEIGSCRTKVSWDDRKRALPPGIAFSIAALDAPVLPEHEGRPHRGCESVFYGGAFWNRCRPGLSHYGRNFLLANQIVRFAFGRCCGTCVNGNRDFIPIRIQPVSRIGTGSVKCNSRGIAGVWFGCHIQ
jgi:hypothetical protein